MIRARARREAGPLLLLLPIGFHLLAFLHWTGSSPPESEVGGGWRRAFILATVLSGAVVALSSELLSLLRALNQAGVALVWGAAVLIAGWIQWRGATGREGLRRLRAGIRVLGKTDMAILAALILLALMLLMVAWVAPPNNVDSLIYHMSKVVHWAQNESLRHFAAINHAQLIRPPWAEMAILHLRTLFGSDRPANLVQWFSMVGSVVAVSGITGLLGGSRKAQLLAAAAAFSVPMGVLQSTSTQNDYAVALWAVCLAYLVVLTKRRPLDRTETAALAGTVGLGMLTKGTFFVYATPLLFWLLVPLAVRRQLQRGVTLAAAIAVAAVTLNLGFWARNFSTYGGPYGPTDALRRSLGIVQRLIPWVGPAADSQDESPDEDARGTPVAPEARLESASSPVTGPAASPHLGAEEGSARGTPPRSVLAGVAAAAATEVRMAAWNLITPSSAVNAWIRRGMELFPSLFDEGYLVLIQRLAWNHEDTAGNPLHLSLVGLAVSILVVTRFRGFGGRCAAFALAAVSTYLLLPAVASVAAGPWGVRYQLPFFLLACPLIACGLSSLRLPRLPDVAAGLLLISAVPYMIFNNTRPIIGKTPWPTRVPSVFVASSQEILLAMVPGARGAFTSMADGVTQLHCDQVGLRIDSGDLEYAFWWLLDAPQSGTHIETLYPLDSLEGLVNRDFVPCAIICSVCGETRDTLNGLDLHIDAGVLKLYAGRGFRWE